MATLAHAISLAAKAHEHQVDKAGAPYILHPLRMMFQMTSDADMIAAVLHDVVEDTPLTLDGLRAEGFSEEILIAVDALTNRDGEAYEEYLGRVAANPISRRVKLADLEDNMDMRRLDNLTEKDIARLQKYHRLWRQWARSPAEDLVQTGV